MGSSPIVSTTLLLVTALRSRRADVSGGDPAVRVPLPCHNGEGNAARAGRSGTMLRVREGSRRQRKAVERQNRGYPAALRSARTVDDNDWISQFDAADRVGVSMARIGFLIQGGRLEPVHNAAGQAGVFKKTVEREATRRDGASPLKRAWFLLADLGCSLAKGI